MNAELDGHMDNENNRSTTSGMPVERATKNVATRPRLNRLSSDLTEETVKEERSNEKLHSVLGPVDFTLNDTGNHSRHSKGSEAKLRDLLGEVSFTLREDDVHRHRKQKKYRKQNSGEASHTIPTSISANTFDEEVSLSSTNKSKDTYRSSEFYDNDNQSLLISPQTADSRKSTRSISKQSSLRAQENEISNIEFTPPSPILVPSEMNKELLLPISTSPSLLTTPLSSNTIFSLLDSSSLGLNIVKNKKKSPIKNGGESTINDNQMNTVTQHQVNTHKESFEIQLENTTASVERDLITKEASTIVQTATQEAVTLVSSSKQQIEVQLIKPNLQSSLNVVTKSTPRKRIKTIFNLDPSNQECADCKALLDIDSNDEVFLSFRYPPNAKNHLPKNLQIQNILDLKKKSCFQVQHCVSNPSILEPSIPYSVFICKLCAIAHEATFLKNHRNMKVFWKRPNCRVKGIKDIHGQWTPEELAFLDENKGNAYANNILERYMPPLFKDRITNDRSWNRIDQYYNATTEKSKNTHATVRMSERLVFTRAKYDIFAFVLPRGPLPPSTLPLHGISAFDSVRLAKGNDKRNFCKWLHGIGGEGKSEASYGSHMVLNSDLPPRLVDFFCVVGINGKLDRSFSVSLVDNESKVNESIQSWEDVILDTEVLDTYPQTKNDDGSSFYPDMNFPDQLSKFIFPDGCKPTKNHSKPEFFTFVLTLETGMRLYGASLCIFDEVFNHSSINGLKDLVHHIPSDPDDPLHVPKALMILSHYPFFDVYRSFLKQLYRISRTPNSPLPIERYIANFTREVPLPPLGEVEINFGFSDEMPLIRILRPPKNKLPLVNFSYRPLFSLLSISNILVVFGCLLQESRVVICCSRYSLLTPICESFLSLIFPFVWQGCYIPVLPYDMQDVLEAPFPYLIGIHSRYLLNGGERPQGVVFVDVDKDIVHLGYDDLDPGYMSQNQVGRRTPALPEKPAIKLKSSLEECVGSLYLTSNYKGVVTHCDDILIPNNEREVYARSTFSLGKFSYLSSSSHHSRTDISVENRMNSLHKADFAFGHDEYLSPIREFTTEYGILTSRTMKLEKASEKKGGQMKRQSSEKYLLLSDHELSDLLEEKITENIRSYFLRFFVKIFMNYEKFVIDNKSTNKRGFSLQKTRNIDDIGNVRFRSAAFLDQIHISGHYRHFLTRLLSSQMFERFLEERITSSNHPEVIFFNESITAKINRSKSMKMKHGGKKKQTPFLDDKSAKVTDIFHPPPPSNWGLPDDNRGYLYRKFPRLDVNLYGKIRQPKQWKIGKQRMRSSIPIKGKALSLILEENEEMNKSFSLNDPKWVVKIPNFEERDAEWAIHIMSYKYTLDKNAEKIIPEKVLGSAQAILMSTRRKQTILMYFIIKLQSTFRMCLRRKKFFKFKNTIIFLQRRVRRLAIEDKFGRILNFYIANATKIQQKIRAFLGERRFKRKSNAAIVVQSLIRGYLERKYQRRLRISVVIAQSIVRGRRARLGKMIVLDLVIKVQSNFRGYQARTAIRGVRRSMVQEHRELIIELWNTASISLEYRSKFWTIVHGDGFLHLGLHEDELNRLLAMLDHSDLEREIHLSQYKKVRDSMTKLFPDDSVETKSALKSDFAQMIYYNMEKSESNISCNSLIDSNSVLRASRLKLERLAVYEKLRSYSASEREILFEKFNISISEKKKKQKLAEMLWESMDVAADSAILFLKMKNEFMSPSYRPVSRKKSKKRFGVSPHEFAQLIPDEDKRRTESESAWVQALLEKRIKSCLTETIHALINVIQSIKEDKNENNLVLAQRRDLVLRAPIYTSSLDKRVGFIAKYFNAFGSEIE